MLIGIERKSHQKAKIFHFIFANIKKKFEGEKGVKVNEIFFSDK